MSSFSNNSNVFAYSFYIPRINSIHTEQSVRMIFDYSGIGTISRVDFTPINSRPGFGVNTYNAFRSAFVHFNVIYDTEFANFIIANAESGKSYKYYTNNGRGEYFLILKNNNPVPETMMNIHQVVDNCRVLEERVAEKSNSIETLIDQQVEKVAALEATVLKQSGDIERLQEVIYHLIGKTFNHATESGSIFSNYNYMKFAKPEEKRFLIDQSDDGTSEYEETFYTQKYSEYAESVSQQTDFSEETQGQTEPSFWLQLDENMGQLTMDDLVSVSTHSSMPPLVNVVTEDENSDTSSTSTQSSDLTWLVKYDSTDEEEEESQSPVEDEDASKASKQSLDSANSMTQRMRFTAELCDNN